MLTLYNILTGKQSLKDHVPVKDASLCTIFGENYKAEVQSWFNEDHVKTLKSDEATTATAALALYLKRIEVTRFTRTELTDLQLLSKGTGALLETAEQRMVALATARLEQLQKTLGAEAGKEAFREEVLLEGKLANWSAAQSNEFVGKILA